MTRACAVAVVLVLAGAASLRTGAAESARLRFVAAAYADASKVGLRAPETVACGPGAQIIVGDTGNNRLLRYTWKERSLTPGSEIRTPELTAPSRVHVTAAGTIYALDGRQRRLVRFDAEGVYAGVLRPVGVPAPATSVIKDFAIGPSGDLYLLDAFTGRVLVLSPEAQYVRTLEIPGDAAFGSSLAVDAQGTVLLLDSIGRRLFSAPPDAKGFTRLGGDLAGVLATMPVSLATAKGIILIVEGPSGSIVGLGRDGTFLSRQLSRGWSEGSLSYPAQLCVNESETVFVADRDNSRIQAFQLVR
jgi:hypothetical protein